MDILAFIAGVICLFMLAIAAMLILVSVIVSIRGEGKQGLSKGFYGTRMYRYPNGTTSQRVSFWTFTIGYGIVLIAFLALVHFQFYIHFGIGTELCKFVFGWLAVLFGLMIIVFPGNNQMHMIYAGGMLMFGIIYLGLLNLILLIVPIIGTMLLIIAYFVGAQAKNWIFFSLVEYATGIVLLLETVGYFFYVDVFS